MEKMKRGQRVDLVRRADSIQASFSKAKAVRVNCEVGTAVQVSVISSGKTGTLLGTNTILPQENHAVSIEVGSSLMGFIKGRGGSTQKKIEDDLEVKIIFPSSRKEDHIMIEGKSSEAVRRALEKIQIIIEEAVESPSLDYSHFVSLPLAIHPELVDKLFKFQNSILGNGSSKEDKVKDGGQRLSNVEVKLNVQDDRKQVAVNKSSIPIVSYRLKASKSSSLSNLGIDKSIFIKPRTFHLTVLMLKLWNKDRVNAACKVLKSISSGVKDALENRPVFVRLEGLSALGDLLTYLSCDHHLCKLLSWILQDCMQGSFAKARVLYAPVAEIGNEGRLLRACQVIRDAFIEAGLVLERDATRTLKLHATVMNARFGKSQGSKKVDSFDARGIFEEYGSMDWGEYNIRQAHLSQRFVFDKNGYYHCCASMPFPEPVQTD